MANKSLSVLYVHTSVSTYITCRYSRSAEITVPGPDTTAVYVGVVMHVCEVNECMGHVYVGSRQVASSIQSK